MSIHRGHREDTERTQRTAQVLKKQDNRQAAKAARQGNAKTPRGIQEKNNRWPQRRKERKEKEAFHHLCFRRWGKIVGRPSSPLWPPVGLISMLSPELLLAQLKVLHQLSRAGSGDCFWHQWSVWEGQHRPPSTPDEGLIDVRPILFYAALPLRRLNYIHWAMVSSGRGRSGCSRQLLYRYPW